jgi:hypothetical protein
VSTRSPDDGDYPYVITVFHEATGDRLWSQIVRDRSDVVGFAARRDDPPPPYRVRIEYAGGDVYDEVIGTDGA